MDGICLLTTLESGTPLCWRLSPEACVQQALPETGIIAANSA